MAPSLVYHGLMRPLLSLSLNIMSVQLTLAAGKDQLTPGKCGRYFIYFYFFLPLYVSLLSIIIIFGVGNLIFLFVCFGLFCHFCFSFVLFLFYFFFFFFFFVLLLLFLCCFLFLFLSFWFELFSLKTFSISLLFISPYSSYQL